MDSVRWSTHTVEIRGDVVTKRYRKGDVRALLDREWRALTLLDAHAPGLAPAPIAVDRDAVPPTVVMSRVPGVPLRGAPVDAKRLSAMAEALDALYRAVPHDRLVRVPVRPDHEAGLIARLHTWHGRNPPPAAGAAVREALREGMAWLDGRDRAAAPGDPVPVFGPGDGNLANYLWDAEMSRIGVVDFEDSGRSDRAFELAEITEHVSGWVDGGFDTAAFLACFDLNAQERARLRECRRLLALTWLFILSADDPAHPRNPPGTAERQALRLRELLG
ncbi:aminoglycoside phosphotransferase family protein [Streptomyces sp. NBC_01591]|uniref:phosphotransferase family protein n=1 Tax=Streptomyces sp. NBC_01591 TaxID=2975888 RepID=UPI002DDB65E9|nr:aminoglycoside phosphotransferase family protein [Streptomyces sp. NBC_01591]WSD69324.1 aminoglycoside phosphotransferase family protein [Streptomyces sp. NBC_01591]